VEVETEAQVEPKDDKPFNCLDYLRETFVEEKFFWLGIGVLFLANIGFH